MKELGGKIMIEFDVLGGKAYYYLWDDNNKYKKSKDTKNYVLKLNINSKIVNAV